MAKHLHLSEKVPCISPEASIRKNTRSGSHCENYHAYSHGLDDETGHIYVKKSFSFVSDDDLHKYKQEYDEIKSRLGETVPNATYIRAKVGQTLGALVLAKPIQITTDILPEQNRPYILEVLKSNPQTRQQLKDVLDAFDEWLEKGKILDLSDDGEGNLVLDENQNLHYIDSFDVFLNPRYRSLVESSKQNAEKIRSILAECQ
jgi:hypothetical protein